MSNGDIGDTIEQAGKDGIIRAIGDQGTIELYPLPELIEADKYKKGNDAAKNSRTAGIRMMRVKPPSALGGP